MIWLTHFHTALSFLTRLGRARLESPAQLAAALPMYPVVGALLGLLFALISRLPLSSWVLAWILIAATVLLTRGLHWDAWADIWDGWGSGATGERFWEIVKDSRLGAFGTLGLILGLGLQASLFELAIRQHAWDILLWSCIWGRFLCLVLAWNCRDLTRPGLGQSVLQGATNPALLKAGLFTALPIFFLPPIQVGLGLVASIFPLLALGRLGRQHGGINGDFLGASIIAGELCALLPLSLQ